MKVNIQEGHFKLKNGKRVYIIHSGVGYNSKIKAKRLMKEISKQNPDYLLIERNPLSKNSNSQKQMLEQSLNTPKAKQTYFDWLIITAQSLDTKVIMIDLPIKLFNNNLYNVYSEYSERLSLILYVAQKIINHLENAKQVNNKLTWKHIYNQTEKYILAYAPNKVKNAIKKESINNIFCEWLRLINYSKKDLEALQPSFLSTLFMFYFLFPVSNKREKYMIKRIEEFSKKGNVVVFIHSGHVSSWLRRAWITKIED